MYNSVVPLFQGKMVDYDRRNKRSKYGIGYDVYEIILQFFHKFHHIYFDNLFLSIRLLEDLRELETYSRATVRVNRIGLPEKIKNPGKLTRGQSIIMQKRGVLHDTVSAWTLDLFNISSFLLTKVSVGLKVHVRIKSRGLEFISWPRNNFLATIINDTLMIGGNI